MWPIRMWFRCCEGMWYPNLACSDKKTNKKKTAANVFIIVWCVARSSSDEHRNSCCWMFFLSQQFIYNSYRSRVSLLLRPSVRPLGAFCWYAAASKSRKKPESDTPNVWPHLFVYKVWYSVRYWKSEEASRRLYVCLTVASSILKLVNGPLLIQNK